MSISVIAVDRPDLPPFTMPDRFRTEVAYFMSLPSGGEAEPPPGEYRIQAEDIATWLDDGVFRLVSPLDSGSRAEIELSEEQEAWLEWMAANQVERIRIVAGG